jgi:hypothetical protein
MNRQPFNHTPTAESADTALHRPGAILTVLAPAADSGRSVAVEEPAQPHRWALRS